MLSCAGFRRQSVYTRDTTLASFCRKIYKLLINQEKGIIQDQTIDKPERRSGCGFRRGVGPASRNCSALAIRSGWQTAPWCPLILIDVELPVAIKIP